MGEAIRSTVKNAAKLAVYDEIMISVKNHQMLPTIRVEAAYSKPYFIYYFYSLCNKTDLPLD